MLAGAATSGKPTLAALLLARAQGPQGRPVAYVDLGQTCDAEYLERCGVDLESVLIARPKDSRQALDLLLALAAAPRMAVAAPLHDGGSAATAGAVPRPAPTRYALTGLKHTWQTLNNCGSASVAAVLSYYGVNVSQEEARQTLRPDPNSTGMGWQVIAPYVARFGLDAKPRSDGTRDIVKSLIANDIPVIVLQTVSEANPISHFRVVIGYDDERSVFYVNDSLLGPNVSIPYDSFDARWKGVAFGRSRYILIYHPEQAALVSAIVGPDWPDVGGAIREFADRPTPAAVPPAVHDRPIPAPAPAATVRTEVVESWREMWEANVARLRELGVAIGSSEVVERGRALYEQGLGRIEELRVALRSFWPAWRSPTP